MVMMLALKPRRIYPSGAALATRSVPIRPAAPGWFSTTIAWPMFSDMRWARIRAALSTALAAASGTIIWIARLGYDCAVAAENPAASVAARRMRKAIRHIDDTIPPYPKAADRQHILC